jgi:uncharacterized cupin superfamily protein
MAPRYAPATLAGAVNDEVAMSDPVEPLILDLLEWIGPRSRPYAGVLDAWRTSCPRLPVWEEANARGFIDHLHEQGQAALVAVSPLGMAWLEAHRARGSAQRALDVPLHPQQTSYPEPFASLVKGREKRRLGDAFGLTNFGVNLTRLRPGAVSSVRHSHSKQDEFVYVIEGSPTLVTDAGPTTMEPGMCAGFKAGSGDAHHLKNETAQDVWYLEVGDRSAQDQATYPDDDLAVTVKDGAYTFTRKGGSPYARSGNGERQASQDARPNAGARGET